MSYYVWSLDCSVVGSFLLFYVSWWMWLVLCFGRLNFRRHLIFTFFDVSMQSGCCKPSDDCNFTYQSPTVWNKNGTANSSNPDCQAWDNDQNVLCFNCDSCKAGFLQNIKSDWKKVAIVNIIFLIFLIIVYSIGCCAFRNNRMDNWK